MEGGQWVKWVKGVKRYTFPVLKYISLRDIIMYSMVMMVNNQIRSDQSLSRVRLFVTP